MTVSDATVRAVRERFAADPDLEFKAVGEELGVSDMTVANWVRGKARVEAGGPVTVIPARRVTGWEFDYDVTESGCWNWRGQITAKGYGRALIRGNYWFAHRLAWTITHGPIPDGLTVDHICWNTRCVNPDHLQLLTLGANAARRRWSSTCPAGHLMEGDNLQFKRGRNGKPSRVCATCNRERQRRRRLAMKAAS